MFEYMSLVTGTSFPGIIPWNGRGWRLVYLTEGCSSGGDSQGLSGWIKTEKNKMPKKSSGPGSGLCCEVFWCFYENGKHGGFLSLLIFLTTGARGGEEASIPELPPVTCDQNREGGYLFLIVLGNDPKICHRVVYHTLFLLPTRNSSI